ncbi:MAG: threonine efflux protein [Paracoccaceae bacterium]|jgi:threonine/homoserine/homoserine lactone efflux protein
MTSIEFLLVLLAWAVGGASPGPATLAIAGTSMDRGRLRGLAVAAGIVCGSAFWGIAAMLGMSALMLSNAWLFEILRYVGASYLLYLAFKSAKSAWRNSKISMVASTDGTLGKFYLKGLLIHLTNPKPIFGWGAIFAVVVPPGADISALLWIFGALVVVSCAVFFGYAFLFSVAGIARKYRAMKRWFEVTFALLFGLAGLKILTTRLS